MRHWLLGLILFALLALAPKPVWADPVYHSSTVACTHSAENAGVAGTTALITGNAVQGIYVCGFSFWATAVGTVQLVYGTGASCTGSNPVTPAFSLPATGGLVDHQTYYAGLPAIPPGNNLCFIVGGTGPIPMIVYYTQF